MALCKSCPTPAKCRKAGKCLKKKAKPKKRGY